MQGPHSRRVDHPTAAGYGVKRPRRGGVAALGISFADAACGLRRVLVGADEGVQQRRFAHAGGANERHGVTGFAPWGQGLHGVWRFGVQRYGDQAALQSLRLRDVTRRIGDGIGLGQYDNGVNASLVHQGQVTFQPGRVEIGVAGGDDEKGIDVGGNQLRSVAALYLSFQQGFGGKPAVQDVGFSVCKHPITYRKVGGFGVDGQVQADAISAMVGCQAGSVHGCYAHWGEGGVFGCKLVSEEFGPTESVIFLLKVCQRWGQRLDFLFIGASSTF